MPLKFAPLLILALGLAIVGAGLWYQRLHPPRVIASGTLRMEHPRTGALIEFETRVVAIGAFKRSEVKLPGGSWIDCAGDCREALLREHLAVFDKMRERGN